MGGTSSKTTSQVLTDIAVNASMNSVLGCTTAATQNQLVQVEQVTGDVTIQNVSLKQGASIDSKCLMTSVKKSEISNAISNALAQYAESQGQAVLSSLGNTKAEAVSNLSNQFQSKIDENTAEQLNTIISQTQGIQAGTVSGNVVIKNVSMDQSAQITAQALMNTTSFSTVINDAASKMDQSSKAKETTIFGEMAEALKNFLLSAVGLVTAGAIFLVVIIVLVL